MSVSDYDVDAVMARFKAAMEGVYGPYDPTFDNMKTMEREYSNNHFLTNTIMKNPDNEYHDALHRNRRRVKHEAERLKKENEEKERFEREKGDVFSKHRSEDSLSDVCESSHEAPQNPVVPRSAASSTIRPKAKKEVLPLPPPPVVLPQPPSKLEPPSPPAAFAMPQLVPPKMLPPFFRFYTHDLATEIFIARGIIVVPLPAVKREATPPLSPASAKRARKEAKKEKKEKHRQWSNAPFSFALTFCISCHRFLNRCCNLTISNASKTRIMMFKVNTQVLPVQSLHFGCYVRTVTCDHRNDYICPL
uniref:Inhibitor_I29 domain-containing protein n=1 Tax=Panagrellus redivivus TaxID=6233 RepID=A0A7E4VMX5_PANRE